MHSPCQRINENLIVQSQPPHILLILQASNRSAFGNDLRVRFNSSGALWFCERILVDLRHIEGNCLYQELMDAVMAVNTALDSIHVATDEERLAELVSGNNTIIDTPVPLVEPNYQRFKLVWMGISITIPFSVAPRIVSATAPLVKSTNEWVYDQTRRTLSSLNQCP